MERTRELREGELSGVHWDDSQKLEHDLHTTSRVQRKMNTEDLRLVFEQAEHGGGGGGDGGDLGRASNQWESGQNNKQGDRKKAPDGFRFAENERDASASRGSGRRIKA